MDKKTKEESIRYILEKGLTKPKSSGEKLLEMFHVLGLRFIFWDMGYSLFFTGLTLGIVLVLFSLVPEDYRYSASLAVAPLFFLFISLFVETSEHIFGLYSLKQTCVYTVQQITALRIICYAMVGFVLTLMLALFKAHNGYDFFALFPLCLAALLICALILSFILRHFRNKWLSVGFSGFWILVNLGLPFALGKNWENFLREVPIAFSIGLASLGGLLLFYQVSKMLKGGKQYVIA